jgi:hypothetical protein
MFDYYDDDYYGDDESDIEHEDELKEDAEELFFELLDHFGPDYFGLELLED